MELEDFNNAINELQWRPYKDQSETFTNDSRNNPGDSLYESYSAQDINNNIDLNELKETLLGSYSNISSRALVEISMQLKRIADSLDKGKIK
jgi:hypothetical protein